MTPCLAVAIIIAHLLVAFAYFGCSRQLGGSVSKEKKARFSKLENFDNGKFIIPVPVMQSEGFFKTLKKMTSSIPNSRPSKSIEVLPIAPNELADFGHDSIRMIWFGHSTFLIQMDGMNILLDPMLGQFASPFHIKRAKRFSDSLPISADELPYMDVVVYSHDHYDHLDYKSVHKIKDKVGKFYVPLGVGSHLIAWGVDENKIVEHAWWDSTIFNDVQFICTPSIHFSGRGLFDRGATLWSSWCLIGSNGRIYFSGDSGYGPHFKEIGDKYGPFDISLVECGQYDDNWKFVHMIPEESVRASIDLKSKVMVPIHWGSFKLANHEWTDPIERVTAKASQHHVPITTPKIGEPIILGNPILPSSKWWLNYQ